MALLAGTANQLTAASQQELADEAIKSCELLFNEAHADMLRLTARAKISMMRAGPDPAQPAAAPRPARPVGAS